MSRKIRRAQRSERHFGPADREPAPTEVARTSRTKAYQQVATHPIRLTCRPPSREVRFAACSNRRLSRPQIRLPPLARHQKPQPARQRGHWVAPFGRPPKHVAAPPRRLRPSVARCYSRGPNELSRRGPGEASARRLGAWFFGRSILREPRCGTRAGRGHHGCGGAFAKRFGARKGQRRGPNSDNCSGRGFACLGAGRRVRAQGRARGTGPASGGSDCGRPTLEPRCLSTDTGSSRSGGGAGVRKPKPGRQGAGETGHPQSSDRRVDGARCETLCSDLPGRCATGGGLSPRLRVSGRRTF